MNFLESLNPEQHQAVVHDSGPLLVLAGAGSGKTKVLTHRIAHLISKGVSPSRILAVTFTNKAAGEMETRVMKMLEPDAVKDPNVHLRPYEVSRHKPRMGTFHSICVRILRENADQFKPIAGDRNFVIMDTSDATSLIREIIKSQRFDDRQIKHQAVLSTISNIKNSLSSPEDFFSEYDNVFSRAVRQIFPLYQERLEANNAVDFDDLLLKTVKMFQGSESILKKYHEQWDHFLIDEYQDTNMTQYQLIQLLTQKSNDICVVGDDHQSIYSFRGADYRNILNFHQTFPNAEVIKLEQNYRSAPDILENANVLISHNTTGERKNLWTDRTEGEKVQIHSVWDEKDEANTITRIIQDYVDNGEGTYGDFAILYRTNVQSRVIEESLVRKGMPYQIIGGTRFFERREVKDIIAYLRLVFNPSNDLSLLRVINTPTRKIGGTTVDVLRSLSREYQRSLYEIVGSIDTLGSDLASSKRSILTSFYNDIEYLRKFATENTVSVVIREIIERTRYLAYLDDGTEEGINRQNNVNEILSVSAPYDVSPQGIVLFLENISLVADIDNHDAGTDSITLMTIHSSKGLEFPSVFLPGWEEGLFPSTRSQMSDDVLEEERRLAYVAITRAEDRCFIFHTHQRMMYGTTNNNNPSRFLSELSQDCCERVNREQSFNHTYDQDNSQYGGTSFSHPLLSHAKPKTRQEMLSGVQSNVTAFSAGDRVIHQDWGTGTVIKIDGDIVSVAFEGQGLKRIESDVDPLQKV